MDGVVEKNDVSVADERMFELVDGWLDKGMMVLMEVVGMMD